MLAQTNNIHVHSENHMVENAYIKPFGKKELHVPGYRAV
jgi:hypothetical protein